jgi:hypothetical protein
VKAKGLKMSQKLLRSRIVEVESQDDLVEQYRQDSMEGIESIQQQPETETADREIESPHSLGDSQGSQGLDCELVEIPKNVTPVTNRSGSEVSNSPIFDMQSLASMIQNISEKLDQQTKKLDKQNKLTESVIQDIRSLTKQTKSVTQQFKSIVQEIKNQTKTQAKELEKVTEENQGRLWERTTTLEQQIEQGQSEVVKETDKIEKEAVEVPRQQRKSDAGFEPQTEQGEPEMTKEPENFSVGTAKPDNVPRAVVETNSQPRKRRTDRTCKDKTTKAKKGKTDGAEVKQGPVKERPKKNPTATGATRKKK